MKNGRKERGNLGGNPNFVHNTLTSLQKNAFLAILSLQLTKIGAKVLGQNTTKKKFPGKCKFFGKIMGIYHLKRSGSHDDLLSRGNNVIAPGQAYGQLITMNLPESFRFYTNCYRE